MSFLISNVFADSVPSVAPVVSSAAAPAASQGSFSLIMIVGIFALFYFMMIRPQNKRAKQHKELIGKLKKGDEIVLTSGLLAKVDNLVNDAYIKITLSSGVDVLVQREAVSTILPKGTLDSL